MRRGSFMLRAFSIGVACLVLPGNCFAAQTVSACGTAITTSGTWILLQNLTCSGAGIDVQVGNVTLKLNGFTITGPGANSGTNGVLVASSAGLGMKKVTILGPGTIADFQNGITFQGTNGGGAVDVTFSGNLFGIFLTTDSLSASSANLLLSQNGLQGGLDGITGQLNTSTIAANSCSSVSDCINLTASSGNRVIGNVGDGNSHAGIVVGAAVSGSASSGNTLEGNHTSNNHFYSIFLGPTASGNHLMGNVAFANSLLDINEFNSHCGTDSFQSDVFGTASQSCVK
jgi:parallel beta-helix repeat protein